ncbi:8298_t:CDS:1 [Ambispora gerdemannii]|uniref:8298_t:CDS:1 n=1 Tax=Ambispora gerdemannii TaxID=144530 RepID=A0A9N9AVA1_9GLOM|nr:8298_t:CDS:1 [Ambispora gerdemannii]
MTQTDPPLNNSIQPHQNEEVEDVLSPSVEENRPDFCERNEVDNRDVNTSSRKSQDNNRKNRIIVISDTIDKIGNARWNDAVLLFILIMDVCKSVNFAQTNTILEALKEYYRVIGNKTCIEYKGILSNYKDARYLKDESEREKIKEFVLENLRIGESNDWNSFQDLLRTLTDEEQFKLRWICVDKITRFLTLSLDIKKKFPDYWNIWINNNDNSIASNTTPESRKLADNATEDNSRINRALQTKSIVEAKKKLTNAELKIEDLEKQLRVFKKEASEHQAALGKITKVDWNDDDPNNSVPLSKDIENLQDLLKDFTIVRGNKFDNTNAENLLHEFGCNTNVSHRNFKSATSAALQRHIIEMILNGIKTYLDQEFSDDEQKLEVNIASKTKELCTLIKRFAEKRPGDDKFTPMAPTKLRQQVNAILGSRAFSISLHPFIEKLTSDVLEFMNKFRQVKSEELSKELPDRAAQVIRETICLLEFRLKTQPQVPTIKFYEVGTSLNPSLMEGRSWRSTDSVVDICYFPIIGMNLDKPDPQVLCKALVLAR